MAEEILRGAIEQFGLDPQVEPEGEGGRVTE